MKLSTMIVARAWVGLLLTATGTAVSAQGINDLERGKDVAARICVSCHDVDGNSVAPLFPKLAGQHAEYMLKQLKEFAADRRTSPVMKPIVERLSADEMVAVTVYFASQQTSPGRVEDSSMLEIGQRVFEQGNPELGVPSCAGCHGTNGVGNARYPRIAGQHTVYVLDQMRHFADGSRTNDRRLMQTIARRLGETETRAVAEYIASLEATK